jgi:glycerol kinase
VQGAGVLLKHNTEVHKAAKSDTLRLGTLDTWLAWRLGGDRTLTDHSTASRTQLLGLASGVWEPELLDLFGVPEGSLPAIKSSLDDWGELTHPSWGTDAAETADLALTVENAGGVRFLPAFTGLGAPWWDKDARGAFFGITGGTTRAHLVRAVLDSIAFRVRDVLEAVWHGGRARPKALRVDGGLTNNRYLMQRQADLLGLPVELGPSSEATATGAAALAAVSAGLFTQEQIRSHVIERGRFEPQSSEDQRETEYAQWQDWLRQARGIR